MQCYSIRPLPCSAGLNPFHILQDKIRLIQDDLESERELRQRVRSATAHLKRDPSLLRRAGARALFLLSDP